MCYINLYILFAIWQINTFFSRGGNKNINHQQGMDAKQLKQMLVGNNWNSESQVKINPVLPKYDVSGYFSVIWGTFIMLLFNVKTTM